MDHTTIVAVEAYTHVGLQVEADALLLVELDGIAPVVDREAEAVLAICREHGADVHEAEQPGERDRLWAARRGALPSTARLRPTTIVEDATVPRREIGRMLALCAEVARKYDITISVVGHAGDGNLHPTFLTDKNDADEMARVHAAIDEIFAGALSSAAR